MKEYLNILKAEVKHVEYTPLKDDILGYMEPNKNFNMCKNILIIGKYLNIFEYQKCNNLNKNIYPRHKIVEYSNTEILEYWRSSLLFICLPAQFLGNLNRYQRHQRVTIRQLSLVKHTSHSKYQLLPKTILEKQNAPIIAFMLLGHLMSKLHGFVFRLVFCQ